ncbi:acyl-CoA dehydrogenase family protein [Paenibacillus koleovorans]|uniref:acyl-CoA dehydrogenase family protein n=1 Tax=Paenibacillus koleovorans TaxID=121608 RepID=UPI000FD77817|nr:acyl-CoA dehydrogenase family protein [Paenibacillus koleovorans]
MELRFTDEQEAMRRKARTFARQEIVPCLPDMERDDAFPRRLVARMADEGLMGIPIPKEWGGAGADFVSYIAAIHELSKASATFGVILSVHTSVGTLPLLSHGTEEQKRQYVPRLAAGEWLGAFALTEPSAGSDAASIRTTATREGDRYILNGSKVFITNSGAADLYLTFAVTASGRGARGITAILLEPGMPGFRVGRPERKMGLHGSNTGELQLDGVSVPAAQRLGEEGAGFAVALGALDGGRIGIAAQALGIAEAALEAAATRLLPDSRNSRIGADCPGGLGTPGGPSRSRATGADSARAGAVLAKLAALAQQVEAARLLVYRAACLRQAGRPCTREASTAKLFASDTAVAVTGEAIELLGPEAWSKELPFERLFRDAKVTQIYEGTNEIHRIVIGNHLLKE